MTIYPMKPVDFWRVPPSPREFFAQYKYNGWSVVIDDGRIWTRRGNEITDWPGLQGIDLRTYRPVHAELKAADGQRIKGVKRGEVPALIIVHDLIVEGVPFEKRWEALEEIVPGDPHYRIARVFPVADWYQVNELIEEAWEMGEEGVVLKRRGSLYQIGDWSSIYSPDWIRMKETVEVANEQGAENTAGTSEHDCVAVG